MMLQAQAGLVPGPVIVNSLLFSKGWLIVVQKGLLSERTCEDLMQPNTTDLSHLRIQLLQMSLGCQKRKIHQVKD